MLGFAPRSMLRGVHRSTVMVTHHFGLALGRPAIHHHSSRPSRCIRTTVDLNRQYPLNAQRYEVTTSYLRFNKLISPMPQTLRHARIITNIGRSILVIPQRLLRVGIGFTLLCVYLPHHLRHSERILGHPTSDVWDRHRGRDSQPQSQDDSGM
jgi:hypothetical protein